jgi:cell division septation protein DedD
MKTLKELNEELDALNNLMNDETDDSPEILAEQERLLNAIAALKAANAAKAAKAKAAKAKPQPTPTPEPAPTPAAEAAEFSVAAYARAHGLDARELRKKLRASGLRAPYSLEQVKAALA